MAKRKLDMLKENNSLQQELDRRARHLERRYSELDTQPKPFDWDKFNQEHPPEKKASRAKDALRMAGLLGLASAAIPALTVVADMLTSGALGVSQLGGAGTLAAYTVGAAAVGGTAGGTLGALNDPSPVIHMAQLEKWKSHLDEFEKKHQPAYEAFQKAQAAALDQEQEQDKEAKVWQERMENTISVATEILPI